MKFTTIELNKKIKFCTEDVQDSIYHFLIIKIDLANIKTNLLSLKDNYPCLTTISDLNSLLEEQKKLINDYSLIQEDLQRLLCDFLVIVDESEYINNHTNLFNQHKANVLSEKVIYLQNQLITLVDMRKGLDNETIPNINQYISEKSISLLNE